MESPAPEEKQLPEVIPTVHVAQLDADRIYWGVIAKPLNDVLTTDVQVPADCDLKPGHYQWDWNHRRFEPLMHLFRQANKAQKQARAESMGRNRNRKRRPTRPVETFDQQ